MMMKSVLFCLFMLFLINCIIPSLWGMFIWKRKSNDRSIFLTFDDGPDPTYTPQLLDVLKQYNIKATFFVLGEKAQRYPQVIKRMHEEGHLIGIHNYSHYSNWLAAPWRVKDEVELSVHIVEGITGIRPNFYRPPWGLVTLLNFIMLKEYQIVLWSFMCWDWRIRGGSDKIKQKLLRGTQSGGTVVLMHDSGDTFGAQPAAPQNTIRALRELLGEGSFQQFHFHRVDQSEKSRTLKAYSDSFGEY